MHCANDNLVLRGRQRGFGLLLVVAVLLVGGTSVYISARDPESVRAAYELQNSVVGLNKAATAIAVYSINDPDRPGSLPCPDDDGSGTAALFAGNDCPEYAARLPWRTIDAASRASRYWYVLDPDFRDHADVEPLNVVVEGSLTLDGEGGYAAVLIDPGDPLAGQTGRGGGTESMGDFFEGENADGDDDYVDCTDVAGCNDRVVGISVDELFAVVQQRVLAEVEIALRQFHASKNFLPFAAAFSGGGSCDAGVLFGRIATHNGDCGSGNSLVPGDMPDWVTDNQWQDHVFYAIDFDCTESEQNCSASSISLKSKSGLAIVMAGAGSLLPGQDRTGGTRTIDDYLESAENTDFDASYDDIALAQDDNDVLRGFAIP